MQMDSSVFMMQVMFSLGSGEWRGRRERRKEERKKRGSLDLRGTIPYPQPTRRQAGKGRELLQRDLKRTWGGVARRENGWEGERRESDEEEGNEGKRGEGRKGVKKEGEGGREMEGRKEERGKTGRKEEKE